MSQKDVVESESKKVLKNKTTKYRNPQSWEYVKETQKPSERPP